MMNTLLTPLWLWMRLMHCSASDCGNGAMAAQQIHSFTKVGMESLVSVTAKTTDCLALETFMQTNMHCWARRYKPTVVRRQQCKMTNRVDEHERYSSRTILSHDSFLSTRRTKAGKQASGNLDLLQKFELGPGNT
jgi:hypothetical protein